jgi:hypothetical protein
MLRAAHCIAAVLPYQSYNSCFVLVHALAIAADYAEQLCSTTEARQGACCLGAGKYTAAEAGPAYAYLSTYVEVM